MGERKTTKNFDDCVVHFFYLLGYTKTKSLKSKSKAEIIFFILIIILLLLRTSLSFLGVGFDDYKEKLLSLALSALPFIQAMLNLWRKWIEWEQQKDKNTQSIYGAAYYTKSDNPFTKRLWTMVMFFAATVLSMVIYFICYSEYVAVKLYCLDFAMVTYIILSAADGILEQLVAMFSAE